MNRFFLIISVLTFFSISSNAATSAPAEGERKIYRLSWYPVPDADQYLVQISADREFKNILVSEKIKAEFFDWFGFENLIYFWRVAAYEGEKVGEFSEPLPLDLTHVFELDDLKVSTGLSLNAPTPRPPEKVVTDETPPPVQEKEPERLHILDSKSYAKYKFGYITQPMNWQVDTTRRKSTASGTVLEAQKNRDLKNSASIFVLGRMEFLTGDTLERDSNIYLGQVQIQGFYRAPGTLQELGLGFSRRRYPTDESFTTGRTSEQTLFHTCQRLRDRILSHWNFSETFCLGAKSSLVEGDLTFELEYWKLKIQGVSLPLGLSFGIRGFHQHKLEGWEFPIQLSVATLL